MLKRRFIPYIVGICIVAFLFISYVGYIAYRDHVEYKAFLSNAQAFYHSIEGQHDHSSHDHTHHGEGLSVASKTEKTGVGEQTDSGYEHPYFVGRTPDGEYSYNIAGRLYISNRPMSQKAIELQEWRLTGKMTPAVEEAKRSAENYAQMRFRGKVIQRVISPDGQLRRVLVPKWAQYEEGDAILQSELDPVSLKWTDLKQQPGIDGRIITPDGVSYDVPEEYYSIEDPYEREKYFKKFDQSIQLGISMAEVEKKIAAGEIDVSLSESEKSMVEEEQLFFERNRLLTPSPPPLSDKPPVKVRFLPDEGEDALPGWRRKGESPGPKNVSEGGSPLDTDTTPVRTDIPLPPLDLPGMVESTLSRRSEAELEASNKTPTPLTAESIETQLRERLSPERFSKVQQLIDRYGSEEGLRRFREMDPEAARQFERERRPTPAREVPNKTESSTQ